VNDVPRFGRIVGTLQRPFVYTVSALWLLGVITYSAAAPGGVDPSFKAAVDSWVYSIAVQSDGKILIGGGFTNVNAATRYCIARLNPDGSLDATFDAGTIVGRTNCHGPYQTNCSIIRSVRTIALQPDGKILIGGDFAGVADVNHRGIARLTPDGSLDRSFDPGAGISGLPSIAAVSALAIQPDAKILLVGDFDSVNGTNRHGIARLNTDGSLEPTLFDLVDVGSRFDSLVVQTDGRIVIGGTFGDYSSSPGTHNNIVRFNSDGSLDPDFDSRGVYSEVAALALQNDGKLLLGAGRVGSYDGQPCASIGRLDTNGVVDTTFSNGTDGVVNSIAVQSDGRILVTGGFTQVNGANCGRIARFQANGDLDQGFTSRASLAGPCNYFCPEAYAIAIQADGKVLVGGSFTTANGTPCKYLVRLFGDELPRITALTASAEGRVRMTGNAATNAHLRLECSANLSDWWPISEFVNTNGTFCCTDGGAATDFTSRFYRAVWLP
jgi:uncharacterized delta-60 repeat protein